MHDFCLTLILTLSAILSLPACKNTPRQPNSTAVTISSFQLLFLDSAEAAKTILIDEKEGFFENIGRLDMAIQLEWTEDNLPARNSLLDIYRSFLQTEVMDFSPKEEKYLQLVFAEISKWSRKLYIPLLPYELKLIKVRGNHYGKMVFYTREKCIVVPEVMLKEPSPNQLFKVMVHELAHIYTRYRPKLKEELYSLIGFFPLEGELVYPDVLKEKLLLNPDGLDPNYYIRIARSEGDTVKAIPATFSQYDRFQPDRPGFFEYLRFELFPIEQSGASDTGYRVVCKQDATPHESLLGLPDFHRQITDNTEYIIHPDEIIADNITLVFSTAKKIVDKNKLSAEGRQLLKKVKKICQG